MESKLPPLALESGLDLRQILTTGSLLQINEDYDYSNCEDSNETDNNEESDSHRTAHHIGEPVESLEALRKQLRNVDKDGFVKKKVLENGGGKEIHEGCTVSVVFSGFWENEDEPFDVRKMDKPLVVDLKENGLLPGLQIAIKSMLVGEMSVFLLSYHVMYGELGVPPRIKPKADCVFYIKLIKSIKTPEEGYLDYSEPNTFRRVYQEVKMLYSSGLALHKVKNYMGAIQLFRKGIYMLHKCRLADETEEGIQQKLLIKLYTNLAIGYNKTKRPLKACTACNELNRLGSLWNNGKVLFQNAKALRMIGVFDEAEKRLKRAIKLCPEIEDIKAEYELLKKTRETCDQNKLVCGESLELVRESFKREVDSLVKNFKENVNLCQLTLPSKLNPSEMDYVKEVCIRENLFCTKVEQNYLLDKEEDKDKD
ncbi:inactive peptidyl-prolyl cis-trans isomerase shutdown-like isoform X2 [Epargyreus clarus]